VAGLLCSATQYAAQQGAGMELTNVLSGVVIVRCCYISQLVQLPHGGMHFTPGDANLVSSGIANTYDVSQRYDVECGLAKFCPVHFSTPLKICSFRLSICNDWFQQD
jgi:hypothetical protein